MEKPPTVTIEQAISVLPQEEKEELIALRERRDWLEHEREMYKLKLVALTISTVLVVFVLAFVISVFKPDWRAQEWLTAIITTAIGTILSQMTVQYAAFKVKAIKAAKKDANPELPK